MFVALISCLVTFQQERTAADTITLRDGRVLLGEVAGPAARGSTLIVARRTRVAVDLPDLFPKWQALEAPRTKQARKERLDRLGRWAKERGTKAGTGDPIADWVDRECQALRGPFDPGEAPLMRITLAKGETRSIERRDETARRMLRQAWVAGLDDPETMTKSDLAAALFKALVARVGDEIANVEELLPLPIESDNEWLVRRAATELAYDPGLRLLRYEGLVFPEDREIGPELAQKALANLLGNLLDDRPENQNDPLAEHLKEIAAKGKVGALVTRLDGGPDTSIEVSMWVRTPRNGWRVALVRRVPASADLVPPNAGDALAQDPQVKGAFAAFEALGLGKLGDDAKRLGLRSGAAVEKALAAARSALKEDLLTLELPVRTGVRPRPGRDQGAERK